MASIFALDLGTTKFCLAALKDFGSDKHSLQIFEVEACGMRRGMVDEFAAAQKALNTLISKAEKELNEDIDKVNVGIAGSHLNCFIESASIDLNDQVVTQKHVDLLSESALNQCEEDRREVLHCLPYGFLLDDRDFLSAPIQMSGQKLSGKFLTIDGDQSYLKDVMRLCNQCGISVESFQAEPVASASVTLEDVDKQMGVTLIDIGGGTTDGIVFMEGRPVKTFTINIAGILMRQDISIGLGIDEDQAERLKREIGLIPNNREKKIEVTLLNGTKKMVGWQDLYPILASRLGELANLIHKETAGYHHVLRSGLVLTGGGSDVNGLGWFLAKQLGIHVRQAKPSLKIGSDDNKKYYATRYATSLGLVNVSLGKIITHKIKAKRLKAGRYINQFINWLKELS